MPLGIASTTRSFADWRYIPRFANLGSSDWCHLCKEYQVGGFPAPEPCTNRLNIGDMILFDFTENLLRQLHPKAAGAFRKLTEDLDRAYENDQIASHFRP